MGISAVHLSSCADPCRVLNPKRVNELVDWPLQLLVPLTRHAARASGSSCQVISWGWDWVAAG